MDETATRDEPLRPARQVDVLPVFAEERAALLAVLAGLTSTEWEAATTCPGWTVRDLAAHLLGDDLGVLSRGRDGYAAPSARVEAGDRRWHDIVASLNELNERWVRATRHLSGP